MSSSAPTTPPPRKKFKPSLRGFDALAAAITDLFFADQQRSKASATPKAKGAANTALKHLRTSFSGHLKGLKAPSTAPPHAGSPPPAATSSVTSLLSTPSPALAARTTRSSTRVSDRPQHRDANSGDYQDSIIEDRSAGGGVSPSPLLH